NDHPTAPDDGIILLVEAEIDQVAAATDSLEDVLDVVGKGGDRLANGREPLGLDLVVIEDGVFDSQTGLVADCDHQHELVLAEPAALAALCGGLAGEDTSPDVGIEDTECGVPSLDRHADRLTYLVIDDGLRGSESLVGRRVGGDDPLALLEDVVDDRFRDR